jgi:glycosyltransferase involved in cell wall biosynthesis
LTAIPTKLPTFDATTPFCFNSAWVRDRAEAQSVLEMTTETVVYTGIDPADFPIDTSPRPPWRWRMLCVGRQEDRKGTHVAVEALTYLPADTGLEICGPGDSTYLDRLAQLARPYGDRVTFGTSSRDELREHYRAADVFLFPVTWDEPFGLVPVEAMACGVPVIATGTGGSAEFLIDGRNCLIVPRSDPQALAAAVRRLATDEPLRERLREGGFVTASEMTVDRLASALWEWHVAAATGFAAGRPADLPLPASSLRR